MAKRKLFAVLHNISIDFKNTVTDNTKTIHNSLIFGVYPSVENAVEDIKEYIEDSMKPGTMPYSWLTYVQMSDIDPSFVIKEYYREEYELDVLPEPHELKYVTLAENQRYNPYTGEITII